MRNKKLAVVTVTLLVLLLSLHIYAMKNHLYIRIPSIDLYLHFLGGACLALSALYITKKPSIILLSTLVLGILWEIFEVYYDLIGWPFGTKNYNIDTSVDIIMDMLGALLVWGIYKYKQSKNEHISDIS